jgi:eukaryotic-like serine/threonine-protein kinase
MRTLPETGPLIGDRFELQGRLGAGGYGTVFAAFDRHAARPCALKILDSARLQSINAFKREFRAAARLSHDNCVRVFELFEDAGACFFSMELADRSVERQRWQDGAALLAVITQVLAGLDHIHARHIIHCDVKPSNILLFGDSGVAKLSDFGIARAAGQAHDALGHFVGTWAYVSPEQADGRAVDPRADLYAVGVVLYELLSGRHPLSDTGDHSSAAWRELHTQGAVRPLLTLVPNAPAALAPVVAKLLAKDPDARYHTAAEAHDAFAGILVEHYAARPPPARLARARHLSTPRLVGRAEELRTADAFLDGALTARPDGPLLLMIGGAPGVGKSRFASELMGLAQARGATVVPMTCAARPAPPFAAIEPLLAHLRQGSSSETAVGHGVTRTTDITSPVSDDGPPPTGAAAPWQLHKQLCDQLLADAAAQTLCILVEDAQWADDASLSVLAALLRSATAARRQGRSLRLAFLVTHRNTAPGTSLADLGAALADEGIATTLDLSPLSETASAELVASMLMVRRDAQVDAFAAAIVGRFGATPLLLSQVLHSMFTRGLLRYEAAGWRLDPALVQSPELPSTLQGVIAERAGRFAAETTRVLAAAAVLGRHFELATLVHVTGLGELELLDCLDEALHAGFVLELSGGRSYAFAHDRFHESLYASLRDGERRHWHARAAAALLELEGETQAAALALHYALSDEHLRAHRFGLQAAELAMRSFAFGRAADLYAAALDSGARAGVTVAASVSEALGDACLAAGRYQQAHDCFTRLLAVTTDVLHRAELLRKIAEVSVRRGDTRRARDLLEGVLDEVGFAVPRTNLALLARLAWQGLIFLVGLLRPWSAARRPHRRGDAAMQALVCRTCARLAEAFYWEDFRRGTFYQLAGVNAAERLGPSAELSVASAQQGYFLATYGRWRIARRYLDRADRIATAAATPVEQSWAAIMRSLYHGCVGDAAAHAEEARRAERLLVDSVEPMRLREALWCNAIALLANGRFDAAAEVATRLSELARDLRDQRGLAWGTYVLGCAHLRRGSFLQAADALSRGRALALQLGDHMTALTAGAWLVLALGLDGKVEEAVALGEEVVRERLARRLRHIDCVADAAFLAAAALVRPHRSWSPDEARLIAARRRDGLGLARTVRFTEPLFLAAAAACDYADGVRRSSDPFSEAVAAARRGGNDGALWDVHALASRVLEPSLAAPHAAAALALQGRSRWR